MCLIPHGGPSLLIFFIEFNFIYHKHLPHNRLQNATVLTYKVSKLKCSLCLPLNFQTPGDSKDYFKLILSSQNYIKKTK